MGDVIASAAPQLGGDQTAVLDWISDRFKDIPAQNDCPAPAAPNSG
jgi:hypothetical protein